MSDDLGVRVRWPFLAVLAVAVVVGAVLIASGSNGGGGGTKTVGVSPQQLAAQARARQHLPAALAALDRFRPPRGFRRITAGCEAGWHCYVVADTTLRAAPLMPEILTGLGVDPSLTRDLPALARTEGLPNTAKSSQLLRSMNATSGPVKVAGCHSLPVRGHGLAERCARTVAIDDNIVTAFIGPYFGCPPGRCRWTKEAEVNITSPSGSTT